MTEPIDAIFTARSWNAEILFDCRCSSFQLQYAAVRESWCNQLTGI